MPINMPDKRWEIIGSKPLDVSSRVTPETAIIPAPILTILANRGISDSTEIRQFLNPSLDQLPQPQLLMGLKQAVAILVEAREKQNPVLVHGDYDADGVTATALLVKFFREIGLPVCYHLPERISEGYGLNLESLVSLRNRPELVDHSAPILLTVDCGISNLNEIAAAKALGFRVIVTDHHQPGPELPDADAIINPHQPGCAFPFQDLAGVGVAFYLAVGLRAELVSLGVWAKEAKPNLKKYLDLVAIGSVADMVPLRGANRVLVKIGLEVINGTSGPGIRALLRQIGQVYGKVTAETIAFQIAPRLNAAGRTGSAEEALRLLLTEEESLAEEMAQALSQANQLRKELSEEMYQAARNQAECLMGEGCLALVVVGFGWYQGIAGLVASKLAREFWRPTVVLALDSDGSMARGSARSIGNFDILACLRECSVYLDKFGGHRAAAGLSLPTINIKEFQSILSASVEKYITPDDLEPRVKIDIAANPDELMHESIWGYLEMLQPHGNGNPEPVFCCHQEGIRLTEVKKVGADSLRFRTSGKGKGIAGIGFGMSAWASAAESGPLRLAYKIVRNNFRGADNWEIRVEDVKSLP
jgi:single-stranded-DNA-specific exonuclease